MAFVNVCESIEENGFRVIAPGSDGRDVTPGFQDLRVQWKKTHSMSTVKRRGPDLASALVAEEVVSGKDVINAQALGAGEPLADVALEQRLIVDDPVVALAVDETGLRDRLTARLATARRFHGSLTAPRYTLRRPRGRPAEGTRCRERVSNIAQPLARADRALVSLAVIRGYNDAYPPSLMNVVDGASR